MTMTATEISTEDMLDSIVNTVIEDMNKGLTPTAIRSRLINNGASVYHATMIIRIAVCEIKEQ